MTATTRHGTGPGDAYEPGQDRWDGGYEIDRVVSPQGLQRRARDADGQPTWPSAIWQGTPGPEHHGLLTLNALIAPDMPRPPLPAWTQWPDRLHLWPAVAVLPWSVFGFWAHTEPDHAGLAGAFAAAGLALLGFGAYGVSVGNTVARDADAEPPDKAGTRALLASGLASVSGAASVGAGFSGIGCMLTAGTLAAAYGGYFGWKRHNRNQAMQAVIAYAAASNPGPLPLGYGLPAPFPPQGSASPYETRIGSALEAMRIYGARIGSPQRIASDVWRFHCELPPGANLSPAALARKEGVLANNMQARRVEIEAGSGHRFVLDVYDGPDRTDETYPWDGTMITSADQVIAVGTDDAGRPCEIDLTEHMLVTGKTRMGKSALIRLLICATLQAPIVNFGIDCKDGAPGLGMFEPVMHRLAVDPLDGMRIQFGIKAVAAARGKLMREKGIDEWDLELGPRIAVYIDEGAELTRRFPESAVITQSNLQLVAASAISYVYGTQTPSGPVWGRNTDARHQFGKRFGFHNEATASNVVFGAGASGAGWRVESLQGKGKFFVQSLEYARPRARKALWVTREAALELVERHASRRQQLDALSAEAFAAGMAAFDAAMEDGTDPFAAFEPPPGGGGGGLDPIDVADDFFNGRAVLSLVPTYPGTNEAIERKHREMWDALGEHGPAGAFAADLTKKRFENFTSDSNVLNLMRFWLDRGYVVAEKDGRSRRFIRIDQVGRADRREA